MVEAIQFIVGNTHNSIPSHRAKRSRNGIRKTHDIQIFLDVTSGNEDSIEKVSFDLGPTFDPQEFVCSTPVRTIVPSGESICRFSTRQQVYGGFQASIKITGAGGSIQHLSIPISLNDNSEIIAHSKEPEMFVEHRPLRPFKMQKVPAHARFGLELELSSAMHVQPTYVANLLEDRSTEVDVITNYREGRSTSNNWKIVPDSSIMCSVTEPDCNKFELVSPPLIGGRGLSDVSRILTRTANIQPNLKVNKSMGFHVHIDVSALATSQLIKVCQQFVKYEDVIDSFMPPSRRSGSSESERYFQSNRQSVEDQVCYFGHASNREIHDAIENCHDITSLANLMNRSGRYYKLNMQNLVSGRQQTIEFRQHSATMNYEKVSAWIRFCTLFCWNSAKLQSPTPFREHNNSMERKFNALFQFVVKDRALRNFYKKRQAQLATSGDDCVCCSDCHYDGGRCASEI